jgi:hypothetical protein
MTKKSKWRNDKEMEMEKWQISEFRGLESFTFNFLLSAFLFKSLGADSSKRPRTPLGAHQWGFYWMKDNTAFCNLRPNYVSCITHKILMSSYINSNHQPLVNNHRDSAAIISFPSYLYVTNNNENRKQRKFNPFKTRRAYTWTSSLREQTWNSN